MTNQIANTIKNQIGTKALYMIGAKNLLGLESGLSFKIGRNSKRVNYVKIILNGLDLYNIEYGWVTVKKYTVKSTEENIYFDGLHGSIERNTGLYTSL